MLKLIKISTSVILITFLLLYMSFLFLLPNIVDVNGYKSEIRKFVTEKINLSPEFKTAKISVSPFLDIGIKAEEFGLYTQDGDDVITTDSLLVRVSVPSLLFRNIKISKFEAEKPVINADIINGKSYKVVNEFEKIRTNGDVIFETQESKLPKTYADAGYFDISKFKITVKNLLLTDYVFNINDLKSADSLKLKGSKLLASYYSGKKALLKTDAELFLNDEKKINAKIDFDTFLRSRVKPDKEDDRPESINIPFINPVAMYKTYNMSADVDSKLKIRKKKNSVVATGDLNIDNFTLMLSGIQLPQSTLHIKTNGKKTNIDADLFVTEKEEIKIDGKFNASSKPSFDINLKTDEIHTDNILNLVKATLDSLHIKHEIKSLKGYGFFTADTSVKTDFKKLKSKGYIDINNIRINNTDTDKDIFKLSSYVELNKNILNIKNTVAEIAQTVINITGSVDAKSITDLNLKIKALPLEHVINELMPEKIKNTFTAETGEIDLEATIKGEMKKALASVSLSLKNAVINDNVKNIKYENKLFNAKFNTDFKNTTGKITDENFRIIRNDVVILCEDFNSDIGEKDIKINPSKIKINKSTEITFEGKIDNFRKKPMTDFVAEGFLKTSDIKRFIGEEYGKYFDNRGILPVKMTVHGKRSKQKFKAYIEADKDNYITPVRLIPVEGKNTVLKAEAVIRDDRLKVKNTGLYIKETAKNVKNADKPDEILTPLFNISGTVTKLNTKNPNINMITLKIPEEINGNIFIFPESSFNISGQAFLFGGIDNPKLRGGLNIFNMSIPEIMLKVEKISTAFNGKNIYTEIKNLMLNDCDYNILMNSDIKPYDFKVIKDISIKSENTNIDNLIAVYQSVLKYLPEQNSKEDNEVNIPFTIKPGKVSIGKISSGNINLEDFVADVSFENKTFLLSNILTSGFGGKIRGDAGIDLNTGKTGVSLNITGADAGKFLFEAFGFKDALYGILDCNLIITYAGKTLEEIIKNLEGTLDFSVKNGKIGSFFDFVNLIQAENIKESLVFADKTEEITKSLSERDTSKFAEMSGIITFKDGFLKTEKIKTKGEVMSFKASGFYNILKGSIDIEISGRLSYALKEALGFLSSLNPQVIVKENNITDVQSRKMFFLYTTTVPDRELNDIPQLTKDNSDNTLKFKSIIKGDTTKPQTLIKSFKWLALQTDTDKAEEYILSKEAENKKPAQTTSTSYENKINNDKNDNNGFVNKMKSVIFKKRQP